jgi:hypothetical protein
MRSDARKVVKNQVFYGSLYQQMDQKYVTRAPEVPAALKSWQKEIKMNNEWNRNPNNPYTKKAREFLLYNSTRPY